MTMIIPAGIVPRATAEQVQGKEARWRLEMWPGGGDRGQELTEIQFAAIRAFSKLVEYTKQPG